MEPARPARDAELLEHALQARDAEPLEQALQERNAAPLEQALQERYAESLAQALGEAGTRAPPRWLRPRLPASIGASIARAAEITGALPEALAAHYLDRAPRELVEQRLRGSDAARALLWRPLEPARLPAFCAAFDGACARLREHGVDPECVLPAPSAAKLLAARPCALELVSGSLLASGLPLLGAGPAERAALEPALASGTPASDADALLDRHLGQHLLHELLHGRASEATPPSPLAGPGWSDAQLAPPWLVREAAALWLQARAQPRHVFPEVAGEAIPGVSLFVLAGEGLAAALGADVLLSALSAPDGWPGRVGRAAAQLFAVAEWQAWLVRESAPFAQDALRAESWSKLGAAVRALLGGAATAPGQLLGGTLPRELAPQPTRERALQPLREILARLEPLGFVRAVRELPSLLDLAGAIPWAALPAWSDAPELEDERRARLAVDALFQENALAPIFVTRPAELRDGTLRLDVERCELRAAPRPQGVFGEPARWTFPPALCRQLHARGARELEVRGALRDRRGALAAALLALARESAPLPARLALACDTEGRWTSSPR